MKAGVLVCWTDPAGTPHFGCGRRSLGPSAWGFGVMLHESHVF